MLERAERTMAPKEARAAGPDGPALQGLPAQGRRQARRVLLMKLAAREAWLAIWTEEGRPLPEGFVDSISEIRRQVELLQGA